MTIEIGPNVKSIAQQGVWLWATVQILIRLFGRVHR